MTKSDTSPFEIKILRKFMAKTPGPEGYFNNSLLELHVVDFHHINPSPSTSRFSLLRISKSISLKSSLKTFTFMFLLGFFVSRRQEFSARYNLNIIIHTEKYFFTSYFSQHYQSRSLQVEKYTQCMGNKYLCCQCLLILAIKIRAWKTYVDTGFSLKLYLKLTLLHECFSHFLNCANGTKLHKTSHIFILPRTIITPRGKLISLTILSLNKNLENRCNLCFHGVQYFQFISDDTLDL